MTWALEITAKSGDEVHADITFAEGPFRNGRYLRLSGITSLENARLAASAPDLLEALEEIADQYRILLKEAFEPEHQKFIDSSSTLRRARTAIAKATGAEA